MSKVTTAHVQARIDSILDAAMPLFATKGIERTTMQEIASDAGLSTGAVYRYFPGKEQLLEAVFNRSIERERALFARASAEAPTRLDALARVGEAAIERSDRVSSGYLQMELALAAQRDPTGIGARVAAMRLEIISLIERELVTAAERREIAADIDLRSLAVALAALVPGLETLKASLGEQVSTASVLNVLGDLLRRTSRTT